MNAHTGLHWFNFSLPFEPTQQELDRICQDLFGYPLSRFNNRRAYKNGYREQWILNPDNKLVTVYTQNGIDGRSNCYFEISGTGLDTLPLDICRIGKYVLGKGGNITQLQVYADSTTGLLPFDTIRNYSKKNVFKERIKGPTRRTPKYIEEDSESIQYGSPKSARSLIIYNKGTLEDTDFPWIRCELTLSNRDDCRQFMQAMIAGVNLSDLIADHIGSYIQFLQLNTVKKEDRTPETWWTDFIGETRKIKLQRKQYGKKIQTAEEIQVQKLAHRVAAREDDESLLYMLESLQALCLKRGLTLPPGEGNIASESCVLFPSAQ